MNWELMMTTVQTVSLLLGILVAMGTLRRRGDDRAADWAVMQRDIEYIRTKVDELPNFRDRLVTLEASNKQAHRRLDRLERQSENEHEK